MSDQDQSDIQNGSEQEEPSVPAPITRPEAPVYEKKLVARSASSRVAVTPEKKTSVQLLNIDEFDGKLIVLELATNSVYLVPSYEIQYRMKPQEISNSVLEVAEKPYDWSEEISKLGVDPIKARIALAREGLIRKDDADESKLRRRLIVRGVIKPEGSNG